MIIQSFHNPKIKHLVQLQNKNYRSQNHEFIAQGIKTCLTLMQAGYDLKAVFMTEPIYMAHQNDFLIEEVYLITEEIMEHVSTMTTPAGIIGIFAIPNHELAASSNAVILHGIQDPGNLGTMIRTATAMNLEALYLIDTVDVYNPKVIQATTGSLASLKIYQTSWQEVQKVIANIPICALVVSSGQKPEELPLQKSILIIGNEGQGLPRDVIQACTYRMTIPMPGKIESLNAAVAGSIAMYLKSQSV